MRLQGQHGYAMAALLVGMSVMAILMTVAMPAWRQMARREAETELVFRGQQYARAIGLFQKRAGPGVLPPNVEVLVEQRFLRKAYKDPITGQDFDHLTVAAAQQPGVGAPAAGRGVARGAAPSAPSPQGAVATAGGRGGAGGIMGVASKSKAESLRTYNGRTRYNEWQFLYVAQTLAPGAGGGRGGGADDQRGRGGQPTPRGNPQQPPPSGSSLPIGRGTPPRD